MQKPLVSIITPVYNAEVFVRETIDSVKNQTYDNWEMILIDDCSKDKSREVIEDITGGDSRFRYIRLDKNSGAAVARNTGLFYARGRFISFLDSDDLWEKNKLEKQVKFMLDNNIGFSFTGYSMIDEKGNDLEKLVKVPKTVDYRALLKTTIIGCLTVMIDRDKIGDFKMPLVRAGQDTATWLSILRRGHVAYGLNAPLAKYRIVRGSISSNKIRALKRTWNTYRNLEKLPLMKCSYYFTNYAFNALKRRILY